MAIVRELADRCSAGGSGPRRASRCSARRSTRASTSSTCARREARVSFGTRWVEESIVEIFREDIARFRALVGTDLDEDPMALLDRGEMPAAQGAAPAQRHDLPLEPRRATASPTASRTCASRTA